MTNQCPICESPMVKIGVFAPGINIVFHCYQCKRRYTEKELEEKVPCAGCGEMTEDSLCPDCENELMTKEVSYE